MSRVQAISPTAAADKTDATATPANMYRVSEQLKDSVSADVHCSVKSVSPIKTSKKGKPCYNLVLVDGKKARKVI